MVDPDDTNDLVELFHRIETIFDGAALGSEGWYILVLSVFTSTGKCHLAANLYTYLISLPQYATPSARQQLIRRLREALVKLTSIIGVARPLEVIVNLISVTAPEDRDFSFSREDWKNDEKSHARGDAWLRKLYGGQHTNTMEMFEAHKDFGWISENITYGLYLSDHSILDGVETELCMLSGLYCLELPRMFGWHLRAFRRVGATSEVCEQVHQCIELCTETLGVQIRGMPRVVDIEHELGPNEVSDKS